MQSSGVVSPPVALYVPAVQKPLAPPTNAMSAIAVTVIFIA
jgi:hypothetical protein